MTGYGTFSVRSSDPAAPASGYMRFYFKSGAMYIIDSAGTVTLLASGTGVDFGNSSELTIASGAITVTGSHHTIDTEGDASTDNLDTINGLTVNQAYFFRAENTARTVVFKNGTGNLYTQSGSDYSLDDTETAVMVVYNGTNATVFDAGSGGSAAWSYALMRYAATSGTNGGTSSATAWTTRPINEVTSDADSIVSLASNQFTPISGTYILRSYSVHYRSGGVHTVKTRLYNATTGPAAVTDGDSLSHQFLNGQVGISYMEVLFTANGTDAYEIQYYTSIAQTNTGLGFPLSIASTEEVYYIGHLLKVG